MKSTDTKLTIKSMEVYEDGDRFIRCSLDFRLHVEDFGLIPELLEVSNKVAKDQGAPVMDDADFLLSCITYSLHLLKAEKDGKPFVLRMDRYKKA